VVQRPGLIPGLAAADYSGEVQEVVHAFKISGSATLARQLARELAELTVDWLKSNPVSESIALALVPAPSRPSSIRQRGYVPAEVLAQALAKQLRALGVSCRAHPCATLDRAVADQSRLNARERAANLEGRVKVKKAAAHGLLGQRVILVDDIVTTGATIRNLTRAILEVGIVPEIFLSFAETL
jgi:predicted amidophosphoribosyltransferase